MMLPLAFLPPRRSGCSGPWSLPGKLLPLGKSLWVQLWCGKAPSFGEGRNRREAGHTALAHAELEAIHQACQTLGDWRLTGCDLYVTLEPCPMCTGAIINAHVGRVVYGAGDDRAGCCGTAADLFALPYSHRPEVYRGFYAGGVQSPAARVFPKAA